MFTEWPTDGVGVGVGPVCTVFEPDERLQPVPQARNANTTSASTPRTPTFPSLNTAVFVIRSLSPWLLFLRPPQAYRNLPSIMNPWRVNADLPLREVEIPQVRFSLQPGTTNLQC